MKKKENKGKLDETSDIFAVLVVVAVCGTDESAASGAAAYCGHRKDIK